MVNHFKKCWFLYAVLVCVSLYTFHAICEFGKNNLGSYDVL